MRLTVRGAGALLYTLLLKDGGAAGAVFVTTTRKALTVVVSFLAFPKPFSTNYAYGGCLMLGAIYCEYIGGQALKAGGGGGGGGGGGAGGGSSSSGGGGTVVALVHKLSKRILKAVLGPLEALLDESDGVLLEQLKRRVTGTLERQYADAELAAMADAKRTAAIGRAVRAELLEVMRRGLRS